MVKLSPRLGKVYDLIPECQCLADIGCDHGYLSIAVAQGKKAARIIAMDINKGPLESAKENVALSGLSDQIELRLSDGLKKLNEGEAEVICICGMGGLLMERIISADMNKAKRANCLILEPQSEYMEFRSFLIREGFVILEEDITSEENKIYPIIKACYNPNMVQELKAVELKYGPCLLKKAPELLSKQLKKNQSEYLEIKTKLQSKVINNEKAIPIQKRIDELEYELSLIDEAFQILGRR